MLDVQSARLVGSIFSQGCDRLSQPSIARSANDFAPRPIYLPKMSPETQPNVARLKLWLQEKAEDLEFKQMLRSLQISLDFFLENKAAAIAFSYLKWQPKTHVYQDAWYECTVGTSQRDCK